MSPCSPVKCCSSYRVRVDFYSEERAYLEVQFWNVEMSFYSLCVVMASRCWKTVKSSMKQGPYTGDQDKIRFKPFVRNSSRYETLVIPVNQPLF